MTFSYKDWEEEETISEATPYFKLCLIFSGSPRLKGFSLYSRLE